MTTCKPDCPECGGVGLVRYDVDPGHPDFGRLHPCPNRDRRTLPNYHRSGLHLSEQGLTWKDVWELDNIQAGIRAVKIAVDRGYGMVFLHGTWGNGKTHLLKVAVSLALAKGQNAAFVNMSDMIEVLRESQFDPDQDNARGDVTYWANCSVLAIDEFDKVRSTEYSLEKRFRLFDERYVMATRYQNVTLIASNDPPGEFVGEIHSRLNDGRAVIVEMKGKDVRPAMSYEDQVKEEQNAVCDRNEKV